MFQFIALAASLFTGGYFAKKALDKRAVAAKASPLSTKPFDEFLEVRSDGLYQFNRQTAISVLGWLGSVSLQPVEGAEGVYDLATNADGSPPALGTGAAKRLLDFAKKGNVVMLSRDVAIVGRPERRAAIFKTLEVPAAKTFGGESGKYAILLVPSEEKVEPTVPAVPGFEGEKDKGIPGAPPPAASEDSDLPNDLRRQVDELLKKVDADDKTLESVARQLHLSGYHAYAAMVEARKGDLRAKEIAFYPDRFFIIPDAHPGAIALAKKVTGDGKKYSDLLAQNPALSALADGTIVPWSPGQVVRLPSSWTA